MGGVLLTLWLALRSFKIIFAILVTLFVGLAITMGLGLWLRRRVQHHLHRLHRPVRGAGRGFRHPVLGALPRRALPSARCCAKALCHTGRSVGLPLALAAAATAVGFFSFLPTDYTGVAELGFVAGRRHDRGLPASHHPAAGASDAAAAAKAKPKMSVSPPGAGWTISGAQPQDCAADRGGRPAWSALVLTLVPALRFQSAGSAQPQGGIGLHPVRPDEESPDLAQHHRRAGAVAGRRRCRWRRALPGCRWWPRR